jgi:hypothetical protein
MKIITIEAKSIVVIACAALMVFTVQPAKADSITFNLSNGNSAISGFTGPYASVLVNRTSTTTATITFTSLTNSGNIYLFGATGCVAVNVNATAFTLGAITGSNGGTGFTSGPYSDGGSGNEDGFGSFNQTIDSFDGFTHSADSISLALTDVLGTWASASDVLAANSNGFLAAAHIFVTESPANASNTALATGYAANGPGTVPDGGSTVLLLGAALSAIGLVRHKLSPVRI